MFENSLIHAWRKKHIPENGRRRHKLHRHQRSFARNLRRASNSRFHLIPRLRILNRQLRSFRQRFRQYDHRPARTHRVRIPRDRLLARHVDRHRNPQQHALRAPPLFRCRRTIQRRSHRRRRCRRRLRIRQRFHSSSPQKSISGATNSTPYSQPPSGRCVPFHTITAELLVSVATLVNARRCSSFRSWSNTTMHPYGFTMRVCAVPPPFGIVPLQANRHAGVHASAAATFTMTRRDALQFARLDWHSSLCKHHAKFGVWTGQWYARSRESHKYLSTRTGENLCNAANASATYLVGAVIQLGHPSKCVVILSVAKDLRRNHRHE